MCHSKPSHSRPSQSKSSPLYFTLAGTQVKVQGGTGWLQHYERAVEVHPTYAPAHYNLGARVGAAAPAAVGDWLLLRARVARLVKKGSFSCSA